MSTTITQPSALNLTVTATAPTACGGSNGLIDLTVTGGTNPYTYSWSNGATTQDLTAAAGTYTVTVTDNKGCTATKSGTIPAKTMTMSVSTNRPLVMALSDGEHVCDITDGGVPNYSYNWTRSPSGSGSGANITSEPFAIYEQAGTYSLTVTNGNGCTATATGLVISEPSCYYPNH